MKWLRPPKTRFFGIRPRLMLSVTVVLVVAFVALFIWFYDFISKQVWRYIVEDAQMSLNSTLQGIDGDEFELLVNELQENRAAWGLDGTHYPPAGRYWEHSNWLLLVHQVEPKAYLYTYIPGKLPDEVLFIGSHGAPMDPVEGARPFESYQDEVLWNGLSGFSQTEGILQTEDEYGSWALTVCAPIRTSRGEVVGAVGVDYLSDYVVRIQARIRVVLISAFLVVVAAVFATLYLVGSTLVNPILRLTEIAHKVGKGEYEQDLSGLIKYNVRDEISTLAEVFDAMLDQLYAREKERHPPLGMMTMDIDRVEVERRVDALTKSEAFRRAVAEADRVKNNL